MKFKDVIVVFVFTLYVVSSAFLEAVVAFGRLVPADSISLGLILLVLLGSAFRGRVWVSKYFYSIIPLLLVLYFSAIASDLYFKSLFEVLIVLFCVVSAISFSELIRRLDEEARLALFKLYFFSIVFLSAICLVDFLFLPGLVSSRSLGGIQGPFRNTGQAGSFFGVHAAICLSLLLSGLVPRKLIYFAFCSIIVLALFLTIKRAAMIGFLIGVMFLVVQMTFSNSIKDKKIGLWLLGFGFVAAFLGISIFQWSLTNVSSMGWRFEYKVSGFDVDTIANGFIANNALSAIEAFSSSPVWGVGMAGVAGVYQFHEIHSTYLGILAY